MVVIVAFFSSIECPAMLSPIRAHSFTVKPSCPICSLRIHPEEGILSVYLFSQIRKSQSFQPFPSATRIAFREGRGRVSIDNHRDNLTVEILISNFHCSFGEIVTEHGTRKVVKSTRTRLFTFWKLNFFVYSFVDSTKAISWSVILKLYEFTTWARTISKEYTEFLYVSCNESAMNW